MRKREAEQVAPRGDSDILNSVDSIGDRRGAERLARIEVPERTACLGIGSFEGLGVVCEENEPAGGSERSAPGVAAACLRILPDLLAIGRGNCQQDLSRVLP